MVQTGQSGWTARLLVPEMKMRLTFPRTLLRLSAFIALGGLIAHPAAAGPGDLLVAPTRIVLEGGRGTEVVLNNIGAAPATYRVSLELRRMTAEGALNDVAPDAANATEKAALGMISFFPRKVVLAPGLPQVIRVGVRPPADLPEGEYRAHMLFRAIPEAKPATQTGERKDGVSISLVPIYGVTIPVIVRRGNLQASSTLSDARMTVSEGKPAFSVGISRVGNRSSYGTIRVTKAGISKPVLEARGLAVYAEISRRSVILPVPPEVAAQLTGPVTVQYIEESETGGKLLAELKAVLR
jgi:hypothetical protein